ncbi:hypothetical protein Skr01_36630 [Sphaerisporangium krabiense]|uniref:Uncharacterized protein n=1 Tax=Sphaerisporangium krabiense TaxID=763782 RepID=A0A7W8Z396_9ACTN|nr:hypothetical protein [Sphaerisporangium krabiense]MBB5626658.1 hypothetical protein [Sphaerisporangium krabiense]GII63578.1 hypothetical protein Skr01_36630 [Sphaerisporangium krabiense]
MTPAEELRAAAAKLRGTEHHGSIEGDTTNPALVQLIGNLLRAREPLATLLDDAAARLDLFADLGDKALPTAEFELAVARVINGTTP